MTKLILTSRTTTSTIQHHPLPVCLFHHNKSCCNSMCSLTCLAAGCRGALKWFEWAVILNCYGKKGKRIRSRGVVFMTMFWCSYGANDWCLGVRCIKLYSKTEGSWFKSWSLVQKHETRMLGWQMIPNWWCWISLQGLIIELNWIEYHCVHGVEI